MDQAEAMAASFTSHCSRFNHVGSIACGGHYQELPATVWMLTICLICFISKLKMLSIHSILQKGSTFDCHILFYSVLF